MRPEAATSSRHQFIARFLLSGEGDVLAREAAKDAIHESTIGSPVEGRDVVVEGRVVELSGPDSGHELGLRVSVVFDSGDGSDASMLGGKVEASAASEKGDPGRYIHAMFSSYHNKWCPPPRLGGSPEQAPAWSARESEVVFVSCRSLFRAKPFYHEVAKMSRMRDGSVTVSGHKKIRTASPARARPRCGHDRYQHISVRVLRRPISCRSARRLSRSCQTR